MQMTNMRQNQSIRRLQNLKYTKKALQGQKDHHLAEIVIMHPKNH